MVVNTKGGNNTYFSIHLCFAAKLSACGLTYNRFVPCSMQVIIFSVVDAEIMADVDFIFSPSFVNHSIRLPFNYIVLDYVRIQILSPGPRTQSM